MALLKCAELVAQTLLPTLTLTLLKCAELVAQTLPPTLTLTLLKCAVLVALSREHEYEQHRSSDGRMKVGGAGGGV